MPVSVDGTLSPLFKPVSLKSLYNARAADLEAPRVSHELAYFKAQIPTGKCVCFGIPFLLGDEKSPNLALLEKDSVTFKSAKMGTSKYIVFMHAADAYKLETNSHGFISPTKGAGGMNELVANYYVIYKDGHEEKIEIRRRHQIGATFRGWGENCVQAVAHRKPRPHWALHEQMEDRRMPDTSWGHSQTRSGQPDGGGWMNWLYAWENPRREVAIKAIRFEPVQAPLFLFGLAVGDVEHNPLRWESRRKGILTLPEGVVFDRKHDAAGALAQISLDLGQVISVLPRPLYPGEDWPETYTNKTPEISQREFLVEYASTPDALFHFGNGKTAPVSEVERIGVKADGYELRPIAPSLHNVKIRVVEKGTNNKVAVRLHIHGEAGEYLPPLDRHRIINYAWYEDYCAEFTNQNRHHSVYIDGETVAKLPMGRVYIEVSKGFEARPVRRIYNVGPETAVITIELEKVLPWRERGWVTADTHVHFLSPNTALLEGAGEGVNVVNLLASQWGELMTNAGDFDGATTLGSKEAGGDGEFLVRVGTENRQHVLGHISLCGYNGPMIAPMTTGGPDESALGDPVEVLLTEWAAQCMKQDGVVILPHFPNPRLEFAATIVSGKAQGLEMTSWGNLYGGINPYSLSDWYRFLNCGYFVAAVGGTDKMSANTAVGTVRTYARLRKDEEFTFDGWKNAIRRGDTFASYGPLLEFNVDGKPMGTRMKLNSSGGTLDIDWSVASVIVPMTKVDLIVNGEIRESVSIDKWEHREKTSVKIDRSSWVALLVRGGYPDKPEVILAHSSPVMVEVEGTPFMSAADAVTILEQIEGAVAYLDTMATRADAVAMKRMRLVLTSAHRDLHNRLHQEGHYHHHSAVDAHEHKDHGN